MIVVYSSDVQKLRDTAAQKPDIRLLGSFKDGHEPVAISDPFGVSHGWKDNDRVM